MEHVLAGMDTHSYNDLHVEAQAGGLSIWIHPVYGTLEPSDSLNSYEKG